ncbi:MAG: DUF3576 domain-containing protein [Celeribacter sp.]|jgi:hypothetical protein
MTVRTAARLTLGASLIATLAACGGIGSGDSGLFGRGGNSAALDPANTQSRERADQQRAARDALTREDRSNRSSFFDLFENNDDPNTTVSVNRYIWNASLDVLNFMPVQQVDPFSGVIVMGYGTPPGGGTAYRATVYVQDPALDARSLRVALASRSGPVSADVQRAIEDAILTRARQLRLRDADL